MSDKNKNIKVNSGNPEVVRIVTTLNGYVFPVFFLITAVVMLLNKAWLTSLIVLVLMAVNLPQTRPFLAKYHIKGFVKLLVSLLLIYLAIMSTGFYV